MTEAEQIKKGFKKLASSGYEIISGTAKNVDETTGMMEVLSDHDEDEDGEGDTIPNVRLRALTDVMDGVLVIPEENSAVIIGCIYGGGYYFLIMASKVKKVMWQVGGTKLMFDENGIVFNDGNNKGLVKLPELVGRMNSIEDALKELQQKHDTHTHTTGCTAGGAVVPATSVTTTKTVTKTKQGDIENELIKQ